MQTKIGSVEFGSCVALAPMAGITDMPLRQLIDMETRVFMIYDFDLWPIII